MPQTSSNNKPLFDLKDCTYIEQSRIKRRISRLKRLKSDKKDSEIQKIADIVEKAKESLKHRLSLSPHIDYPDSLPVSERSEDILHAIQNNQVVIVAGETGSGKTTQLPKICLEAGLGRMGLIGHTQPRRLAARSVASRLAEELKTEVGDLVGYQVRFTDQVSDSSFIKVMTDGILLSEISRDRNLYRYDAIIIDEAHERSLNIDFLLGYLKNLLSKRSELKVIITSATIDVDRFSKHFANAPVIEVSGRSYPVNIEYRPRETDDDDVSLSQQIEWALQELVEEERERRWQLGDVLVFLPGEREIREVAKHLRHSDVRTGALRDLDVMPLYARLSNSEQAKVFQSHAGRRVVLSTNVAETSITVPGIRYVIDTGLVRMSRYSYRSKIQRLPIERISQASANQRAGRCGRVAEGICYRLYSEDDYASRPEFTDPEILRTNLASVILKMKDAGLGDVYQFPFVDLPDRKLWNDGFKLLFELGAVDAKNELTQLGKRMAVYPTDPRIAKLILESVKFGCVEHALIVASALSIQDPRDRPADKQQAADQAHAAFRDEESDFVSFINIWKAFENHRQELSNSQLKRFCQKNFLSFLRMREWRDLHRQLRILHKDSGISKEYDIADKESKLEQSETDIATDGSETFAQKLSSSAYESLHRVILSAFIGQIGSHDEKREYRACRNRRFQVFPASSLSKRRSKWLVSAEIVETQNVYARTNARIDVEWVEPAAQHLIKKSWSEPHWQKKRGQVAAYEKVTLYGLEIVAKRLVNFGLIDPPVAREIFIRSGIVEGLYESKCSAVVKNRALINEIESLEDKTRRRDVLEDDSVLYDLYDRAIPEHVVSAASFEKWFKALDAKQKAALEFTRDQLVKIETREFDASQFPDTLENNGIKFPLSYHFDPTSDQDGVTVSVPISAARQLGANALERLVPGLLKEKCIQLIKNLPRTLRKNFVPVPSTVDAIYPNVESSDAPLLEVLTQQLKRRTGVEVPFAAWDLSLLDKHLRFNIEVVDDKGRVLESGRELGDVVEKVEHLIDKTPREIISASASANSEEENRYRSWDFEFEQSKAIRQAGIEMQMFPALKQTREYVQLSLEADKQRARQLTRLGLARLYSFRLKAQIAEFPKLLPKYKQMALLYAPVGQSKHLYDEFALMVVASHFNTAEIFYTKEEFDQRYETKRSTFIEHAIDQSELCFEILERYHKLMKQLKGKVNLSLALPMSDLQSQIESLVFGNFLSKVAPSNLENFPRYLEACEIRLEKMPRELAKERQYVPILKQWLEQYAQRKTLFEKHGIWDDQLDHFRWLIEEQRVSWYAQQLGTIGTVSEKRLNKYWESIRRT